MIGQHATTPPPSTGPARAKRSWWGFLLRAAVIVVAALVLLVMAAPTLMTSRPGERWLAGYLTDMLGRPVEVEGVSFGWITPLRIDRVELPPLADEGKFPAARIEGLKAPITLWVALMGAPYEVDLECEALEGNFVKRSSGAWNWLEVSERFAGPATAEPEPPSTEPTVLPLGRLKARFAAVDLRVVDASQDLDAGVVDGAVAIDWPGGAQPMTMDAQGALALNNSRMPWDIRAKLDKWIDAQGRLTLDTASVTSGSDAMRGAHQISDGGYFIHVGAATSEANEVRVVLPLGELATLARESGWAPLASVPAMQGALDWHIKATRHGNAPRLELTSTLDGKDLRVAMVGDAMRNVPPIDLHHLVEATIDHERQQIDVGMTVLNAEGLHIEARASNVPFAEPMKMQALTGRIEADFAPLSSLASRVMGGDGAEMLSGTLSLNAQALPRDDDHNVLGLDGSLELRPGLLTTLGPFAANDDLLASGSLNLAPLGFRWSGDGSLNKATGRLQLGTDEFEGDVVPRADISWTSDDSSLASWIISYDVAVDLGRAHETLQGPLMPGIDSMSGIVGTRGEVTSKVAGLIGGEGLSLGADDLSLTMMGWAQALEPGPFTASCGEFSVDQAKGHARFDGFGIEGAGMALQAHGVWNETFDITTSATLDLAAMGERLAPVLALPSTMEGVVALDATGSGTLTSGDLRLAINAASDESLTYGVEGVLFIDQPLTVRARAEATTDADGAPSRVALWIDEASWGELAALSGHAAATPGASMEMGVGFRVGYEPLLTSLDPSLFEASELAIVAGGTTELSVMATGLLDDPASPWMPRIVESTGRLTTNVDAIEWAAGEAAGGVGGVSDERTFAATINMADMAASTFEERGRLAIDAVDGPDPIGMSSLEFETETRSTGFSTWQVNVPRLAMAEARYAIPMTAQLNVVDVATSATLSLDLAAQSIAVANLAGELAEVARANARSASFNWSTGAWAIDGDARVGQLRDLDQFYTLDPVMAETLPGYAGALEATINASGTLDAESMFSTGRVPFLGDINMALDDAVLNMRDGVRMNGVDIEMAVSSPGDDILLLTGKGSIGALSNAALAPKPLRDAAFEFEAGMLSLDQVEWRLIDFDAGNWRTRATASGKASGLRPALAGPIAPGLHYWLDAVRFETEARIEQDFAGFNNYLDPLTASGVADVSLRIASTPQTALTTTALLDLRDIDLAWGEVFSLTGLAGTTELRKTLVHGPLGRVPPTLPAGELRLERMAFGLPPYVAEMKGTRVAIRGFEPGLSLHSTTTELLAGTAATTWDVSMREGDPTITGRIESTGLDLAALAAELTTSQTRRSWEMNGVADLRWRLRDVQGARFMEDLTLAIRSTRIGDRAFRRLLDGLDPRGDNPQLIAARRALVLGSPDSTSFTLEGGLVSFDARLKSTAGLMFPLPILDRQPYSGLFAVYGLDETVGLMGLARLGLVLMLAPDVATIEAATGMNRP